ncbi:GNAT family N-acetyltransferase [Pseudoalteromonas luteoviolacea]|uniref:N-acetyltransferase domain-containing protein n=1 Tax=Pseudoalteromonas luteoviolacea S4054 TaxID=1129367 RepID=A0A0F6A468_9GAMM|nr:GNAT family N-acetyltransferase [Pseudoalteromonas luteoviolacea]AOT11074.1 acetyltransferase [Pseudoalteromonas luteoviolacea]AOT15762.1 acetyltransferase [Pseudoalteromonas luteoviolacea]AOT20895.1 acetyltransferase [Pseudoalteromonas luteoviolacea]KKE80990.1 hypothetical protein N479_24080 [Pseudoalteromonas luteoviolacea S4054]KZN74549.1 hypothetical protein N481_08995 [Pseudoalteromonas luteoviolacea S4047-1]
MDINFKVATTQDSVAIAKMVVQLTSEICHKTNAKHFNIDVKSTSERCQDLLEGGHYLAIIGTLNHQPVAVATMTETYALYAGGKIGVIQEFYVSEELRSKQVGSLLIEQIKDFGRKREWACIELCTPPLPEFERTLSFYQRNGLLPVGGRKMRQTLI